MDVNAARLRPLNEAAKQQGVADVIQTKVRHLLASGPSLVAVAPHRAMAAHWGASLISSKRRATVMAAVATSQTGPTSVARLVRPALPMPCTSQREWPPSQRHVAVPTARK